VAKTKTLTHQTTVSQLRRDQAIGAQKRLRVLQILAEVGCPVALRWPRDRHTKTEAKSLLLPMGCYASGYA